MFLTAFSDELMKLAEEPAAPKPPPAPKPPKPAGAKPIATMPPPGPGGRVRRRGPVVPPMPGAKPAKPATPPVPPAGDGVTLKKIETPESRKIRLRNEQIAKQKAADQAKLEAWKKNEKKMEPYDLATKKFNELNADFNTRWKLGPKGNKPIRFKTREERDRFNKEKAAITWDKIYNEKENTYIWKDPDQAKPAKPATPAQQISVDPNMGLEGLR